MSEKTRVDPAAWLDELEKAHGAAIPERLKTLGVSDGHVEIHWSDAASMVAAHNALPALLAIARGVFDLAEELRPMYSDVDPWDEVASTYCDLADRIRAVVMVAIGG